MKPLLKETNIERDYTNTPVSIGAWAYGPSVLQIQHGIDDYALIQFYGETARWLKIHTNTSGRSFIRSYGVRYYFDECTRL